VRWRFALTPKWIIRHLLVAGLVVGMIALGFWQLRRLDEKQAYKALVEARQEQPPVNVVSLVPADAAVDDAVVDSVLYRSVVAIGTFQAADTVTVENRTLDGTPGAWVLTPLRVENGAAVVVNRGFVPFDEEGVIVPPPPPTGVVQVEGLVFPSQRRGSIGPTDPAEGTLDVLARVDLDRLAAQLDYDLLPAYVQVVTVDPPEPGGSGGAPDLTALGPPELSEGSHLSYAIQWFIFTTIAGVGYGLLLRKVAREEGALDRSTVAA
jgi:surfeit locus 1 family protein